MKWHCEINMIEIYRIGIRTRLAEGVRILCNEEIKLPEGNRLAGRKSTCRKEIDLPEGNCDG